jgi:DNA-binding CsgD family transcriptional regulator
LQGRSDECALLDGLLTSVRGGDSRTLVLRGDAGVGKTALLDQHLIAAASDMQHVRAMGVESEMELAYASLHQVCAPLGDHLERLPRPQRDALEIVFGFTSGTPPDALLVGVATLSLLCEAAEVKPLLCVVDDAQWLDQASARTLAFVGRRLRVEPVGLVFAARDPGEALAGLPELEVRGLPDDDAQVLLASSMQFPLDERIRDRIVAETQGNPLALLELPRGLTAIELAAGFGLLGARSLSGRIEESFARRLETLSDDTRALLLIAAAEPVDDPLLLWRAAERLGIDTTPSLTEETDGLLSIGGRVTFRHPLVRSAVYRASSAAERREVHLALAEVTDRQTDPDRRAWHLAAAAAGPDEAVALELERSAGRAQSRGGLAAAAAFLERSAALSRDPLSRTERALAAAEASFRAGAFDTALTLVATAEAGPLDEFQGARVDLLRGHLAFASGLGSDAPPLLLEAARRLQPLDLNLARETYLAAWGAAVFAGPAGGDILVEICTAVRDLPSPTAAARPLDMLLDGLALLTTDGRAAAAATLQDAAQSLAGIPLEDVLRWGWVATAASDAVWDDAGKHAIATRHVQLVRDAGVLAELPIHLAALGLARAWIGDFAGAASLITESESVAAATGSPIAPYALLRLRALQGREAEASAVILSAIERDAAGGQGLAAAWAYWAAAVLNNGLGRYEEAASAARQATSNNFEPWVSMWALPELVEAAMREGDPELARDALDRLQETTQPCATDFAFGIEARSRALVAAGDAAESSYREAIERLGRTLLHPELARAHLLYGEWLRRENRRVDAREQLRSAYKMLSTIGMEAFAERARGELLATGEKVRKRTAETRDDLTPQERQISRLVRDGLSNPEIGTRLFLSPRTVEWHLHNVFIKLGVGSRRELRDALRGSENELIAA